MSAYYDTPGAGYAHFLPIRAISKFAQAAVAQTPASTDAAAGGHSVAATEQPDQLGKVVLTPTETPISPPCEHTTTTINCKYREMRLMAGRAYQALGLPNGSWNGAREFFITALVADLRAAPAFGELLIRDIDSDNGRAGTWQAPNFRISDDVLVIDNRGQSLLATGHVLVNLLGAHADASGRSFAIDNAQADEVLPGLRLELKRYGIDLHIVQTTAGIDGTVRLSDDPQGLGREYRSAMNDFFINGRAVDAKAFWELFYRGNAGLDVDTPISRQHTGGTVLDVIRPGERITKQFTSEELHLLTDPDELDNQNIAEFISSS